MASCRRRKKKERKKRKRGTVHKGRERDTGESQVMFMPELYIKTKT